MVDSMHWVTSVKDVLSLSSTCLQFERPVMADKRT